jgi:hypothetical protein
MGNDIQRIRQQFAAAAPTPDKKITDAQANKIIASAREGGLTEAKAEELKREVDAYKSSLSSRAASVFSDFIDNKMKSLEILNVVPPTPKGEPALVKADQKRLGWQTVEGGKLFIHGVSGSDTVQNYLGDCYLMAAMSAVAHTQPKDIQSLFTRKPDGTYDVTLYADDGGKLVPHVVNIDDELPRNGWYGYYYAGAKNPKELWPALLEKAVAKWKGGYNAIQGGLPENAMEWFTGKKSVSIDLRKAGTSAAQTFQTLEAAVKAGKPATAVTLSDESEKKYAGTKIFTDHTYTVWGTSVEKGVQYVHLRNPWGDTQPGNGPNDGIFKIPLSEFMSLFCGIAING